MKTIALLLFTALALSACATDEQEDVDVPDRLGLNQGTEIDTTLDGPAADWVREQLLDKQHVDIKLDGVTGEWAEEILLGDKLYTLLHGLDGNTLLNSLGEPVICRACQRR